MKQELHKGDDDVPASKLAARTAGAPGPSAEGLVGVTELLDACVANLEIMPQLDDVVKVGPFTAAFLCRTLSEMQASGNPNTTTVS